MSIRALIGRPSAATRLMTILVLGALTTGCPPRPPPTYPFVPMHEAIRRVNENNAKLCSAGGGVKASPLDATVRFREHEGAPARQFSFSGALAFHAPRDLILQLREGLGNSVVMQAGSNEDEYWLWIKPEIDTFWWGTYPKPAPESAPAGEPGASSAPASGPCTQRSSTAPAAVARGPDSGSARAGLRLEGPDAVLARSPRPSVLSPESLESMPIRPDDLIEVLGLNLLPTDTTGPEGPVYRPEPTRNVLIFLDYDEVGQGYIQKEYHLDRAAPYLVREIIFRETDGRIRMQAALSGDAPVRGGDVFAAYKIRIEWPSADSWLELRIRRFTLETEPFFSPENPQTQGLRAGRVIRVHAAADEPVETLPRGAL